MTEDRREHRRANAQAHFMLKIGLDGSAYGFGNVHEISSGGLVVEADLVRNMGLGVIHRHVGREIILLGAEGWNRHFSIMARIVRITHDERIACSICSVSSEAFLQEWLQMIGV